MDARGLARSLLAEKDIEFPSGETISLSGEVIKAKPLSLEEKEEKLVQLIQSDAGLFLERYGRLLSPNQLELFRSPTFEGIYEVNYYLQLLTSQSTSGTKKLQKNRRYRYMEKIIAEGDFFSEEEMKIREPSLYHHYVGKYKTSVENKQMYRTTGKTLTDKLLRVGEMDFADELIAEELQREEEEEEDSDEEEGDKEDLNNSEEQKRADYEEFFSLMKERFLDGKEQEFDYHQIDNDSSLDDLEQMDREAEESYFNE